LLQVLLLVLMLVPMLSLLFEAKSFAPSVTVTVSDAHFISHPQSYFPIVYFFNARRVFQVTNHWHALDAAVPFFQNTKELLLAEKIRTEAELWKAC
jgi:hypothetical protein